MRGGGDMAGRAQTRQPFIGPLLEGTRMIALTQGQYALVDEDDYETLAEGPPWFARWNPCTKSFYALRNKRGETGQTRQVTELMHQFVTGSRWKSVDHQNHDTLNNRKFNLRDGKHNNRNRRAFTGGTSEYKGVSWCSGNEKWRAQIWVDGTNLLLGDFDDEIDAAAAYDAASLKHHGQYGLRNF